MKQKKWFDTTPRTPSYCGMVIDWSPSPCLLQSLHAMIINGTTVRVFGYLALSCFQAKYPNPNRNSFWQAAVSWEFFQILRALSRKGTRKWRLFLPFCSFHTHNYNSCSTVFSSHRDGNGSKGLRLDGALCLCLFPELGQLEMHVPLLWNHNRYQEGGDEQPLDGVPRFQLR